ncbi:hypothetical protein KCU65_g3448, partial [Aureobasidium melanogenum]
MTTSRSLLGLPNELLAMIIGSDGLTVTDLASLRLTCKHAKHFASSNLGKRTFVDIEICDEDAGWIETVYEYQLDKIDKLLNNINSCCLSSLVLGGLQLSVGTLKALLEIHQETLSTLDIRRCTLVDGTWLKILNFIRSNMSQLGSFRIHVRHEATKKILPPKPGSRRPRNQYHLKRYSSPIKLKLQGQKEIANGLSELLKAREVDQAQ